MHVLMSAYNCDPRRGSDAQIGWRWAMEVAQRGVSVTVLTDAHNRGAIEGAGSLWRKLPLRFVYVGLPGWNWPRAWRDSALGMLVHPVVWQWASLRVARAMLDGVDLIHHVTNVTLTHGNALSRLPRPFVFGPVGGGETAPTELARTLGPNGRAWEGLKRVVVRHLELHPLCGPTLRRAAIVVCATAETRTVARRLGARRSEQMLDYGVSEVRPARHPDGGGSSRKETSPEPVVLLVGSMVYNPKKGYRLGRVVLERLLARRPDLRVVVTGLHPSRSFLRRLETTGRLRWLGATPYERMSEVYREASVLLYPSLRESTGSALMEAMAHGLPIVSVRSNSRESLPTAVGVLVAPGRLKVVVDELVRGVERLLDDPASRRVAAAAALRFARTQTWRAHASDMVERIYPLALRHQPPTPTDAAAAPAPVPVSASPTTTGGGPPLSVLLVSEPGVDGVFRHVESLADYLLGAGGGVAVHLAYSTVRGGPALDRLVERVRAGGGRTLDLRVGNAPGPADAAAFLRLRRFARAVRPDVIHAHSSKAGALARALAWAGVRARFFYTPHAYYKMHEAPGLRGRVFRAVERGLARVSHTINISASEAEYARRELGVLPAQQSVIRNGVDGGVFRPPADRAEVLAGRARLGLPADDDLPLLGTVARFSPQKDPVTLYRAVLLALGRAPGWRFVHLGQGELEGEVDAMLAAAPAPLRARVFRLPALAAPAEFYRALDGFVLPSRYEGLSLAALEAAATGLPLILSDCPGNADLRAHPFDRVWWTSPGEANALAENILAWAATTANAVPGRSVPCNHHLVARADFARDQQFDQILQCYAGAGRQE